MGDRLPRFRAVLPWLGLFLTAALSLPPLLFEQPPVEPVSAFASAPLAAAAKAVVLLAMLGAIGVAVGAVRAEDRGAVCIAALLGLLAALLAACHWFLIDRIGVVADWQRTMYFDILNHRREAPHQFRPLPYGFARTLEHITGDWTFACVAYRWFFTYWFLWGCYRFARVWHSEGRSLLTLVPVAVLYPLSICFYWGQLTDPLSHALFVLALLCTVRDRTCLLAASLALGILAKETVVLMVPVYWCCYWRGGLRPLLKTAALGAVCAAAFLAVRLPFGWRPGYANINGTEQLMIFDNLGVGPAHYHAAAPIWLNYVAPALFVLPFVPFLVYGWRRVDPRLKMMCVTLTPLLLLSNLCFGWMYEARNYMPLLPLLATAALAGLPGRHPTVRPGSPGGA
ncbi:MAG TPA: hypothetical protein VMS17_32905 [Gemmataceae bacterium]|nr:hypothetical protein [Gemmataceae bacterium]